ncbi:hypothetical protein [Vibrio mexicanus]|uniref:hypothetical protein n=1 Tax=Vibrio mexicanus TaxID=1004326 RepID=UPI00063CCDB1|nr:hypothetical protein [Vibrio mexicanus]
MKTFVFFFTLWFSCLSFASNLPALPSQQKQSPHGLYLSSEHANSQFDSWKIDGGYSYNLFKKIDLYVGARIDNSDNVNESGIVSGVNYQVNHRVSVKSTLHSYSEVTNETRNNAMSAELSSRLRLTENLDLHATLDYQEWQQGVEFGLGFRF